MRIGANYQGEQRCDFIVWAPQAQEVAVRICSFGERILPMEPLERGYWRLQTRGVAPGADYCFRLADRIERPDPASCSQPQGVHGPSRIIDHAAFAWNDRDWRGLPLEELVIYELHVGVFTGAGTFAAVIPRLAALRELGITAIELMPVAQFPGQRNWGYDGACPFAVQDSYGGVVGLKELVDACHRLGLAVILDVVYNHLGPEGNYLRDFGPYFTDRYRTPWGEALNFDGPDSDEVRHYFSENALHWLRHYHVDALRLDAVHAIYDFSARPFLQELADRVRVFAERQGRHCQLIAESDLNDVRIIRSSELGGYGLDAQWNDDFHHALHTLLTEEKQGYYADFGTAEDLGKACREGFVYSWRHSAFRQRHHGSSSADRPGHQLVVSSQNHDQVGNRLGGERLITLAGFEAAKLAAAAVLFSPFIPLLFMGEEYGEEAPFLFFTDFSDPQLRDAVRRGRKEEFRAFDWPGDPPDPNAPDSFQRSTIDWENRSRGKHGVLLDCYRELLRLRRELPALAALDKRRLNVTVSVGQPLILLQRWQQESRVLILLNFCRQQVIYPFPEQAETWRKMFDSAAHQWSGPGTTLPERVNGSGEVAVAPVSAALYVAEV